MAEEIMWEILRWWTERNEYTQGYVKTEAVSDVEK